MQQGGGKADLLAHPGGVVHDQRPLSPGRTHDFKQILGALGDDVRIQAAHLADEGKQFPPTEPFWHGQAVRKDAHQLSGAHRICLHIDAENFRTPGVRT